jgi:hypothetical protein
MVEINPETQKTRKERLTTVIAIGISILVHLSIFLGGLQLYQWAEEEEKRELLMVIRRIQGRPSDSFEPTREVRGRRPSPPEAKIKERGPELPPEESHRSEETSDEITDGGGEVPPPEEEEEESIDTTVSVVTDLSTAAFTLSGPEVYNGTGTFWTKKNVPPGDYTASFHPVPGYKTPPISTKALAENSRIVFVGKYTRSVEVEVVVNNVPGVTFEIRRPDGILLGITRPGRAFFEDLPLGPYSIAFNDVTGYLTPAPQAKNLEKGGRLVFVGSYLPMGKTVAETRTDSAPARMDRRVQMIVKSYPSTSIEDSFDSIRYPEIIIKRSNFQRGWCRVYLVLTVGDGRIRKVHVERPRSEEREQYARLIEAVEAAVGNWDYDNGEAEVHVDVRFYVE